MLPKDTQIYISYHPSDEILVMPVLEQIKAAGWRNVVSAKNQADNIVTSELIRQSGMFVAFLSKAFAQDEKLILHEFAYAASIIRKPFLPVWLESLPYIQQSDETYIPNERNEIKGMEYKRMLISSLEMLTAKNRGITANRILDALLLFSWDLLPDIPSTPQICEKPCVAYEGKKSYAFVSYAHDNAPQVYPIIKTLFESGWNLWYDEGIELTEPYFSVIADHIKYCSVFILMLTPRCLQRPFIVWYELEYALRLNVKIITVIVDDNTEIDKVMTEKLVHITNPKFLCDDLKECGLLCNKGTRMAIPPAVKNNYVYDIIAPEPLPNFDFTVCNGEIALIKYKGSETHITVPATHQSLPVTIIRNGVFAGCEQVISIDIPDSVSLIENDAFADCQDLLKIRLPVRISIISERLFFGCKSLTHIKIPAGVTKVESWAFALCYALKIVEISKYTDIADDAFLNLNLKKITFVYIEEKDSEGDNAMCPSFTDNTNFTNLYTSHRTSLQSTYLVKPDENISYALLLCDAYIYNDVMAIAQAMYDVGYTIVWKNIEDITYHDLSECTRIVCFYSKKTMLDKSLGYIIKTVSMNPEKLMWIFWDDCGWPDEATDMLKNRHAIWRSQKTHRELIGEIKKSLMKSGCHCNHIRNYEVENQAESVKIIKYFGWTGELKTRQHVIIPNMFFDPPKPVVSIGAGAFKNLTQLDSVDIPDTVRDVGEGAFKGCRFLTRVEIPKGIEQIGANAFWFCESLESIQIPQSVISIGAGAFGLCKKLTTIIIPQSVTEIGENAFIGCSNLTIFCPKGSYAKRYAKHNKIHYEVIIN